LTVAATVVKSRRFLLASVQNLPTARTRAAPKSAVLLLFRMKGTMQRSAETTLKRR